MQCAKAKAEQHGKQAKPQGRKGTIQRCIRDAQRHG